VRVGTEMPFPGNSGALKVSNPGVEPGDEWPGVDWLIGQTQSSECLSISTASLYGYFCCDLQYPSVKMKMKMKRAL
jgi:hypothetical protein